MKFLIKIIFLLNALNFSPSTLVTNFFDESLDKSFFKKTIEDPVNKDEVNGNILKILGLPNQPSFERKPSLTKSSSKFLIDMYHLMIEDEFHSESKHRKVRNAGSFLTDFHKMETESCNNIITFSSKLPPRNYQSNSRRNASMEIWFNINKIPKQLDLRRSELRLYQSQKRCMENESEVKFSVSAYVPKKQNVNNDQFELISLINTTAKNEGWLKLDVTPAMSNWILNKNLGESLVKIAVHRIGHKNDQIVPNEIGLIGPDEDEEHQPFMIGFFDGPEIITNLKRAKREIKENTPEEISKNKIISDLSKSASSKLSGICQRINFTVDFSFLNWNSWIIAPNKFEAYYCGGECNFPLGADMNATNHALVQTLMHLKHPYIPKPCCAPKELGSISVLYHLNEENVNLRKYRHIVAKNCGCH